MNYEDSQPYKLGCMFEEIGKVLKNPKSDLKTLVALELKYGFKFDIEFIEEKTGATP